MADTRAPTQRLRGPHPPTTKGGNAHVEVDGLQSPDSPDGAGRRLCRDDRGGGRHRHRHRPCHQRRPARRLPGRCQGCGPAGQGHGQPAVGAHSPDQLRFGVLAGRADQAAEGCARDGQRGQRGVGGIREAARRRGRPGPAAGRRCRAHPLRQDRAGTGHHRAGAQRPDHLPRSQHHPGAAIVRRLRRRAAAAGQGALRVRSGPL